MSKKKGRLQKPKAEREKALNTPVPPPAPPSPTDKSTFKGCFSKTKIIVGIVVALLGGIATLITFPETVRNFFASDREKYRDDLLATGILLPPELVKNPDSSIYISVGGNSMGVQIKYLNTNDGIPLDQMMVDIPFKVVAKVIENRLYISARFRNLKDEPVGYINFKTWEIIKPRFFDWQNTDSSFEVIDDDRNVMFNMKYSNRNELKIHGYTLQRPIIPPNIPPPPAGYKVPKIYIYVVDEHGYATYPTVEDARSAIENIPRVFSLDSYRK